MRTRSALPAPTLTGVGMSVLLALTAFAPTAHAQQTLSPMRIESDRVASDNARADSLEARAREMYSTSRWYIVAARLHRRAALLRGDDPKAVESFRSAAWLYSVAGKHQLAREMMENAAERATAFGDVEGAANAYIDAAYLAIESSRQDQVPDILARMHAVLSSPLLTESRRAGILKRIGDAPSIARLDTATHAKP